MSDEDRDYLNDRAEAELVLAQKADHPEAVRAHYLLAGYYLDRLYGAPDAIESAPADEAGPPNSQGIPASYGTLGSDYGFADRPTTGR